MKMRIQKAQDPCETNGGGIVALIVKRSKLLTHADQWLPYFENNIKNMPFIYRQIDYV